MKSSVCRTSVQRTLSICDNESIRNELDLVNDVLKSNSFPKRPFKAKSSSNNLKNDNNNSELIKSVFIPRIGPASHRLERILHSNNIKVYHNSHQKIHQTLYSRKDKTDANLKPSAHRILLVYSEETGRNLMIRQKEHLDCYIKENCDNSTIAKQAWMCDHKVNWDMSFVLAPIDKYFARKTGESIEIVKHWAMPQETKPLNNI